MDTRAALNYSVLLIAESPDERGRVALAFVRAAPNVRLCIAHNAKEARSYLLGTGIYSDRDAYPAPQLILLDLDLPQKSAFDVLQWLRAAPGLKQIPVIVLTSPGQSSDVDRAYALGANSCILKTVNEKVMHDIAKGIGDYAALLENRSCRDFRDYETISGDRGGGSDEFCARCIGD